MLRHIPDNLEERNGKSKYMGYRGNRISGRPAHQGNTGPEWRHGGQQVCQGYVVVYKGGGIPEHDHETVESYTIIKGHGEMEVDGEKQPVKEGDCIFIPGNLKHALYNTGEEELHMMFVYAPSIIVDHWAKEQSGEIK